MNKPIEEDAQITVGSGNVYADFGVPNAGEEKAKFELAFRIRSVIMERGLTQEAAASLLNIDQPEVSRLMNCRTSKMTFDRLFRYLKRLEQTVEVRLPEAARDGQREVVLSL
jgi:predicted XRE-type DNA-binding protein